MSETVDARDIRSVFADVLAGIAPEVDFDALDPEDDLQRQADLDSMDFLALLEGLGERLGVDIPEADYGKLSTPSSAVGYLAARTR